MASKTRGGEMGHANPLLWGLWGGCAFMVAYVIWEVAPRTWRMGMAAGLAIGLAIGLVGLSIQAYYLRPPLVELVDRE